MEPIRSEWELKKACDAGGAVILAADASIHLTRDLELRIACQISGGGTIKGKGVVAMGGAAISISGLTLTEGSVFAEGKGTTLACVDVAVVRAEGSRSQTNGIFVESGAAATVEGGRIVGAGDGIVVAGAGSTVLVTRVAVESSKRHAVTAKDGGVATVRECAFSGSGSEDQHEERGGKILTGEGGGEGAADAVADGVAQLTV